MHPRRKLPLMTEGGGARRPKIASRQRQPKTKAFCCGLLGEFVSRFIFPNKTGGGQKSEVKVMVRVHKKNDDSKKGRRK